MNEIWGSYELGLVWGWAIALYLFLAGLSSGAMMCALSVEWLNPNKKKALGRLCRSGRAYRACGYCRGFADTCF